MATATAIPYDPYDRPSATAPGSSISKGVPVPVEEPYYASASAPAIASVPPAALSRESSPPPPPPTSDRRVVEEAFPTCWGGYQAPAGPGAQATCLKALCIAPAGVAYILGAGARIVDNTCMCVCMPCIGSAYASYKLAVIQEDWASGGRKIRKETASEIGQWLACIVRWERWRKLNGKVIVPTWCPCGVCFQQCGLVERWPSRLEDVHGHWLEAPCQVCLMDQHSSAY
jgi:hypothetical protein